MTGESGHRVVRPAKSERPGKERMEATRLLGIRITPGTVDDFCEELSRLVHREGRGFIVDANTHGLNLAWRLPWMKDFYNRADIVYVDGAGVVLGAGLLGGGSMPRLTMADLGWPATSHAAARGHSLYLLGNPPGVAAKAAEKLIEKAPSLKIVGTHHGFFEKTGPENDAVIEDINRCKPDILMVGMGMPLEQKWVVDNHARITAKVFWTVGAAFQYWAGTVSRCPRWMGEHGLEWFYRLLLEPRRMAGRYLAGNTVFLARVLMEWWKLRRTDKNAVAGKGTGII